MTAFSHLGFYPQYTGTDGCAPVPLVHVRERMDPRETVQTRPAGLQDTSHRIVELLATLHHEFRTPLAVIQGYTSLLLKQGQQLAPEECHEFLQMMLAAGTHMQRLTERLLEIAQLEAGTYELQMDRVDLPPVARTAITRVQRLVPTELEDRFTFQFHCRDEAGDQAPDLPPVKGDGRSIQKVLEHLLENAVRFSPEGGHIDVIAQPVAREQASTAPFLEIRVCDPGVGIAREHLEAIFEPFYQVDTTLTRQAGGPGLGLAICKHLVALHQGRLWAESCPAGGSAFHLWLPIDEPTARFA